MRNLSSFEKVSGFNDRWIIILGLPIASLLITFLLYGDVFMKDGFGLIAVCAGMSVIHTATFWFSLRWAYVQSKRRYPRIDQIGHRIIGYLISFLVVYFIVNKVLVVQIMDWFSRNPDENDPNPIVTFISAFLMSAILIILYEAIAFYIQLQKAVAEKVELERQNVESQLEGLRNQVNPHFLFNSLNTLAYLIPEDADKAVRFLQQLSNVYRYVLESREAKIIPMQKELAFLDAFVYLLKERFGDNLNVKVDPSMHDPGIGIVPLTLQMLFENAIKHNVISSEKPLTIELFRENGHFVVRNNLQKKNQVMDSTGVGLQNIQDRYRMLTDQEVKLIASQQYFTVALPIIKLQH